MLKHHESICSPQVSFKACPCTTKHAKTNVCSTACLRITKCTSVTVYGQKQVGLEDNPTPTPANRVGLGSPNPIVALQVGKSFFLRLLCCVLVALLFSSNSEELQSGAQASGNQHRDQSPSDEVWRIIKEDVMRDKDERELLGVAPAGDLGASCSSSLMRSMATVVGEAKCGCTENLSRLRSGRRAMCWRCVGNQMWRSTLDN